MSTIDLINRSYLRRRAYRLTTGAPEAVSTRRKNPFNYESLAKVHSFDTDNRTTTDVTQTFAALMVCLKEDQGCHAHLHT